MTRSTRRQTARACQPQLEGLEDRHLLSSTITEFPMPIRPSSPGWIAAVPDVNPPLTVVSSDASGTLAAPTTASMPPLLLAPLVLDSSDIWDGLRP
jgi:hypothetical protein